MDPITHFSPGESRRPFLGQGRLAAVVWKEVESPFAVRSSAFAGALAECMRRGAAGRPVTIRVLESDPLAVVADPVKSSLLAGKQDSTWASGSGFGARGDRWLPSLESILDNCCLRASFTTCCQGQGFAPKGLSPGKWKLPELLVGCLCP